jgi:hypothetical protein
MLESRAQLMQRYAGEMKGLINAEVTVTNPCDAGVPVFL